MTDFDMYASNAIPANLKPACASLFCQLWLSKVPLELAKTLLQLLIVKHKFNINKSKDFAKNLIRLVENHSKNKV